MPLPGWDSGEWADHIAITLTFLVIQPIPGDPADLLLGDYATPKDVQNLRYHLDLNKPLHMQYLTYVKNVLKGDIGTSLGTDRRVISEIFKVFTYTLLLSIMSPAGDH